MAEVNAKPVPGTVKENPNVQPAAPVPASPKVSTVSASPGIEKVTLKPGAQVSLQKPVASRTTKHYEILEEVEVSVSEVEKTQYSGHMAVKLGAAFKISDEAEAKKDEMLYIYAVGNPDAVVLHPKSK